MSDSLIILIATVLPAILAGVLGACIASFLCVVVERVPRGKSINGRSHCICGRQLSAAENIPVISWLALRGRSRCCKSHIPGFYVAAEASLGAVWFLSVLLAPPVVAGVLIVLSTATLVLVGLRRTKAELAA